MPRDESKDDCKEDGKEDSKDDGPPEDVIDVTGIKVAPNDCDFHEPLELDIEFSARRPLKAVTYLVDTVHMNSAQRHLVPLGRSPPTDYSGANQWFEFRADKIPVEGIAPSALANCGLLTATLCDADGEELVAINLMVQVSQRGGELHRMIFNPLG